MTKLQKAQFLLDLTWETFQAVVEKHGRWSDEGNEAFDRYFGAVIARNKLVGKTLEAF